MPNYDARAIANEFIKRAQRDNKPLTNMQLQKLPYIAHGWSLAILGTPLIAVQPEVWPYGPVYRGLYKTLSRYGSGSIDDFIHENDPTLDGRFRGDEIRSELTLNEEHLLDRVWAIYGGLEGWQLSALTHQKNSPWSLIKEKNDLYASIDNETILKHYQQKQQENRRQREEDAQKASS